MIILHLHHHRLPAFESLLSFFLNAYLLFLPFLQNPTFLSLELPPASPSSELSVLRTPDCHVHARYVGVSPPSCVFRMCILMSCLC